MAILQALFALISRSAGKVLNAAFGWAVSALFGRTSAGERTFLSGVVAAAALWPLLLVGVAFPKAAAWLLALVPIPKSVPDWTIRLVWLGLVVLIPVVVGLAIAAKGPPALQRRSFVRRLAAGFPITLGLALTFLLMFVSVPLRRLWAVLRRRQTADIPLVSEAKDYHPMVELCTSTLRSHGFRLAQREPGWWVSGPIKLLQFFGGEAFAGYVPDRPEYYRDGDFDISFYPSGILVRGRGSKLTWAQGLLAEATARGRGFQTTSKTAQDVEKQIRRLWKVLEDEPDAHVNAARLMARADEVARLLGSLNIGFDDWQVLYRQLLQLDRALHGHKQLLESQLTDDEEVTGTWAHPAHGKPEEHKRSL